MGFMPFIVLELFCLDQPMAQECEYKPARQEVSKKSDPQPRIAKSPEKC